MLVVVQSNPEWASFARHVLADESLIDDARFVDNPDRITNVEPFEVADVLFEGDMGRFTAEELHKPLRAAPGRRSGVFDPFRDL